MNFSVPYLTSTLRPLLIVIFKPPSVSTWLEKRSHHGLSTTGSVQTAASRSPTSVSEQELLEQDQCPYGALDFYTEFDIKIIDIHSVIS